MQAFVDTIESRGALLALLGIVLAATALEFTGHLSSGMVSVLEWAGGSFFAAQSAAHVSSAMAPASSQNMPSGGVK